MGGIAAYYRGDRSISAGICRDFGCHGCSSCKDPYVPEPRPEGWGSKALERAKSVARRTIAAAERYSLPTPDRETLIDVVRQRARVGVATAEKAVGESLKIKA